MIRFSLKCPDAHVFESWFQSGAAFDRLCASGHVVCPECGAKQIEKSLMAPRVQQDRTADADRRERSLSTPSPTDDPRSTALAKLKAEIEANSDYVGLNFASEARKMHAGDAPERAIYGEARPEEARKLLEDGVPVAPLPFMPRRKVN